NNVSKKYDGYCNDIFFDNAMEFIEENGERPFFTYVATNLPHFPLQIAEEYVEPYRGYGVNELNAKTYGMITNIDDNVGRLLKKLEELNLEDDTIVIFLSDNGPRTSRVKNDRYPDRYNNGFRGTKTSIYEGGIHVPFFIRWPERFKAAKKISTIAAHIDVLPTLLDACSIKQPKDVMIDGVSLMPLIRDEKANWPDRTIFFQWHNGDVPYMYVHFAARSQRFKLVQPWPENPHIIQLYPTATELRSILANIELYDIENDPYEIDNIAAKHPDVVQKMLADYENWFSDVTSERDYHHPQKIYIGTPYENPVMLSRFDWRGFRARLGLGWWDVNVTRSGRYNITLRHQSTARSGEAHFRFGKLHIVQPLSKASRSCTFNNVPLETGEKKMEAWIKFDRESTGVNFVDVELVN
ncbi:sulfatase-like hydrolase/transferase, partial [Candidatus Latescibacterota bacterium]